MNPEDVKFKAKLKGQKKLFKLIQIDFEEEQIQVDNPYMSGTIIIYNFEDVEQLLQWTGFKDKEGNEIYEGDKIEINCRYGKEVGIITTNTDFIDFGENSNIPDGYGHLGLLYTGNDDSACLPCKIVGNVYEED